MTLAKETISRGTKNNSMYETNTVRGSATASDMREYLAKESCIKHSTKKSQPNAMKPLKLPPVDLQSISPIKIECDTIYIG